MSRTRDEEPRDRPTRIPFSASSQKTQVTYADPDFLDRFFARWFNDQRDRIQRALNASYQFVEREEVLGLGGQDLQANDDMGSRVSMVVTGPVDGNPEVTAYLMKLDRRWYNEDQELKKAKRIERETEIREGRISGAAVGNQYGDVRTEIKHTG